MSDQLKDRVAIVTGGSRGIGRATALRFAQAGARAVVVAAREQEALDAVSEEIEALGGDVLPMSADVGTRADCERVVRAALEQYGRIDILVNNAGRSGHKTMIADMTDEQWQLTLNANLNSVFYCSRAVIPHMVERRWGRIINLASRAGVAGHTLGRAPGLPADADYATAKAAVIGFTRALAYELAPYGITANAVAPGPIATEMLLRNMSEQQKRERAEILPVQRLGLAEEVAEAILYLASPLAGFTTGELLNVNGGAWFS